MSAPAAIRCTQYNLAFTAEISFSWVMSFWFQRRHHVLIHRILTDDMMDRYGLALSLPPQSGVGLLVKLQAPGQSKPNEDMAALLDV